MYTKIQMAVGKMLGLKVEVLDVLVPFLQFLLRALQQSETETFLLKYPHMRRETFIVSRICV
jgi:hypothetical protein